MVDALDKLNSTIKEDDGFFEAYLLQADIYSEIDSTLLQIESLEKAVAIDSNQYPKSFYVLGNAYYSIGLYQKAKIAYQQFLKNNTSSTLFQKAEKRLIDCDFALKMVLDSVVFNAENMGNAINTNEDEYWPSLTIDGETLVFTRLVSLGDSPNEYISRYQEDFFVSQKVDGEWQEAEPMISINTVYNEGAQSISADGKLIFFTACTQSDGFGSCDIYFARNINGEWSHPQNAGVPVNSGSWESQPSISANGELLYFTSNRKGGKGGMDLWRCQLNGFSSQGKPLWGTPQNMGDSINTSGSEMSPFIHPDGKTLYFSSDTWMGMGGMDIFYARMINDSVWEQPTNMGYPINTYHDEQGLIVDGSGKNAYYSSNRSGSNGLDLYRFGLYEDARPATVSYIKGRVIDGKSLLPLNANVELVDIEKGTIAAQTESSLDDGEFLMCLSLGKEYAFNVSCEGYLFFSENFSLTKVRSAEDPFVMDISLNPLEVGSSTVLRNIFYQSGSFEILNSSKSELSKLIGFLNDNPNVKVEIEGHTDNVGSTEYNDELSENRAKSVFLYLIDSGIPENRLSYKGYGMSLPFTSNDTAAGRSQNRRTEFRVVSID